ncbi:MAG: TIGR02302 family protein [Hyphomicrobium sp.]
MTGQVPTNSDPRISRAFARKVRLGTWALFFERVWPRAWLLLGLIALFAVLSLSGMFLSISALSHKLVLAAFAVAAIAAIVYAGRAPWPTREETIRRIERRSGVAHRPATSYEDTLTAYSENPETKVLWQAHRERLARAIARLRVGRPSPRTDRFDPMALRALALLLLIPAGALVTGSLPERLLSAFSFGKGEARLDTRVDAWVTPPPYTALPPVMLADGAVAGGDADTAEAAEATASTEPKLFEVPANSLLTLRGTGFRGAPLTLEILSDGAKEPVRVTSEPPKTKSDKIDVTEVRFDLKSSARVRALAGTTELGRWTFDVTPDQLPTIVIGKDWSRTPKGSLKVTYKGEDDYGVTAAIAKMRQMKPKPGDPSKAWAQPPPLKGPRLPLEPPPELALKIPRTGAKTFEASTLLDLGAHPWAGQMVEMWLEATDTAGQVGRSEYIEVQLPARRFVKPLARALIEQRRKLAEDSRHRPMVAKAIDALTIEPEGFIEPVSIYIGLRSVFHRLERENTRTAIANSITDLWEIALKIEDGALSDAESMLKAAQDRLAKALEEGADDAEIAKLLEEMKQALSNYLKEMQKNADKDGDQNKPDGEEQQQQVGQEDFDQMMKDLEENARNGSREEAERMLSEMREMMDRLQAQSSPEAEAEREQAEKMMKKLNDLSDLSGEQQKLMDDTFGEQSKEDGQKSQQSKKGKAGDQAGQQKRGQQGQPNQMGSQEQQQGGNEPGSKPDQSGRQRSENSAPDGKGGLKDRQSALRKKLEKLQRELDEMGAGDAESLQRAEKSMQNAEEALESEEHGDAAEEQGQALEQMRQAAQQMAEQMQQNARQRASRGENSKRDPLDRPQRSEGPDLGNSVKVPNAIDAQRAREILEELRRRSGEALRPTIELDYIERLLRRF